LTDAATEVVTEARWFRWRFDGGEGRKSSSRQWSSLTRCCCGQSVAGGNGPWRTVVRRSGGRGRRWRSVLGVRAAKEKKGNGLSSVCWCYWAEEGGSKSRRGHGARRQRGGGGRGVRRRLDRSRAAWRAREVPEERGLGWR
jgi:hypothetical protein